MIDFAQLHFIRPYFLLAIVLLPLLCLLLMKVRRRQTAWRNLLPAHLQRHQIEENSKSSDNYTYWLLGLVWILSAVGLAGPSWEKLPQPVYQTQVGKVVIIDMSMSMRATDISPDRLTRAKFKSLDLLESIQEGEIGLIAYAGDAFIISPLTDDIANLQNLIPSLSPEIMPVQGSNPLVAFDKAKELLINAGYQEGEIYWITDGIEYRDIELLQEELANSPYKVSSLIVGTKDGAPIKMADGSLLKDATGKIVIPRANENYIQQALSTVRGQVTRMTTTASDIDDMVIESKPITKDAKETDELSTGDVWEDMGVYIAIALLPLVAYFFRKGVLVCFFVGLTFVQNDTIYAQETQANDITKNNTISDTSELSFLNKLFLNPNQQGEIAYHQEDYANAQLTFKDPSWKAASAYKLGDYERALDLYESLEQEASSPEQAIINKYNKANSLAKLTRLEEALDAYNAILKEAPNHEDALKNKAIVEAMLEQQEQQQQEQQQEQNQDGDNSADKQQQNDEQKQEQQGEQSQDDSQQSDQQSQEGQQNQSQEQQNAQNNAGQDNKSEENQDGSSEPQQNEQQAQDENRNNGNEKQNSTEQPVEGQEPIEENPDSVIEGQIDPKDLSPEEREQLQKMQMLMNKVPDDPAFLLKRKMLLESQTRRQNRAPVLQQQTW